VDGPVVALRTVHASFNVVLLCTFSLFRPARALESSEGHPNARAIV
jgi:hypothetical protein